MSCAIVTARRSLPSLNITIGVDTMEIPWKPLLFWTPRVLCLLFAVFLSLFALDVFNEGYGFWKTILALLMHLIPTWIVLAILAISWRWEWAVHCCSPALAPGIWSAPGDGCTGPPTS